MTRRRFAKDLMISAAFASAVALGALSAHGAASTAMPEAETSHASTVVGNTEYPFAQLVVEPDGRVVYLDVMYGHIDETTTTGTRVLLSSLRGTASPSSSIVGLSGLALARSSLWFTADGVVYESTLDGRTVKWVGPAPGAMELDVRANGTVRYSTETADYELTPEGTDERIAGGGDIPWREQGTPQRADAEALNPIHLAATGDDTFDFVNENVLYRVVDGIATQVTAVGRFFNGALAHGEGSVLYGICDWAICRIEGTTVTQLFSLAGRFTKGVPGDFIAPCALAVGAAGTFYLSYSDQSSKGHAGVLKLSKSGQVVRMITSRTTSS